MKGESKRVVRPTLRGISERKVAQLRRFRVDTKRMASKHAVVVAGAPRSGTTWVAEILAEAANTAYVHEPDNHSLWPLALRAKAGLGRQPALSMHEQADLHDRVWNLALSAADNTEKPGWALRKAALRAVQPEVADDILAGRTTSKTTVALKLLAAAPAPKVQPATGPLIVKTVHAGFCLERVAANAGGPVIVVVRNPRNGIASWLGLNWDVHRFESDVRVRERILPWLGVTPPPVGDHTVDTAWTYALLDASLRKLAFENPDWIVAEHEDLSEQPIEGFRALFDHANLPWSNAIEKKIQAGDADGTGYKTTRVRADLRHAWKSKLDDTQIEKVEEVLAQFRLQT